MINFEDELKKFHPSLEIKDSEKTIYNQDLTDVADIFVELMQEQGTQAPAQQPVYVQQPAYVPADTGYIPVQAGQPGFIPQETGYLPTDEIFIPLEENGGTV